MVHAWAEDHRKNEEECDTGVESSCDYRVEACLTYGADDRQESTQKVEFCRLRPCKPEKPKGHHPQLDDYRV